jgi:hypothetical protein
MAKSKKTAAVEAYVSTLSEQAQELYAKALNEKADLTLIPEDKAKGNHVVKVVLVDKQPVVVNGMVVVEKEIAGNRWVHRLRD